MTVDESGAAAEDSAAVNPDATEPETESTVAEATESAASGEHDDLADTDAPDGISADTAEPDAELVDSAEFVDSEASADDQLQKVLNLAKAVDAEFIAKTAVYSREKGFMKDMPAVLCAALSVKDAQLLRTVFDRVIDDGKMLRNFVQVLRSGVVGRAVCCTDLRAERVCTLWL